MPWLWFLLGIEGMEYGIYSTASITGRGSTRGRPKGDRARWACRSHQQSVLMCVVEASDRISRMGNRESLIVLPGCDLHPSCWLH